MKLAAGEIGTPFQKLLGLRWEIPDDGSVGMSVEMNMRDEFRGPVGSLEGGIISVLADVAGASAIARSAGMIATQHIALSFLAPGRVGPIRATGVPLRVGRDDGVAEVRIVDVGKDHRLMAVALVTVRILHDRHETMDPGS
ncbi:MAG: PaaI family thioesterase [Actinobacteria bacterium]|jgi:uncharacterized protein (TIGR00369 family)|nr:PaaI family thioesterase [Actinomycetota bacterium]MCL5445375.1 PaaI family thioesterase [Actinomycetota bacterium]